MNFDELFTAINLEALFQTPANRAWWYNHAVMWVIMNEVQDELGCAEDEL